VSRELANALKAYAIDVLGFDLVGIAPTAPSAGAGRLRDWVERGCHAGMGYIVDTLEVRCDPGLFLPGARSAVCVAMGYHDSPEPAELAARGDRVVVARYARRSDYHKVLKRRLVRLGCFLRAAAPGARWRVGVDEHPVLERDLAQLAGLGWIGKNTCLINRHRGSELLLGELITDRELPADRPESNHCGTCVACVDACPTRALAPPWRLDSRRCISYLTIEHRDQLPEGLKTSIGAHLFGCDISQAVCPWNRGAPDLPAQPLRSRPHLSGLRVGDLQRLDAEGWDALTAGSPLRRLSFIRFLRNLSVVAGNLGRSGDLDDQA